MSDVVNEVVSIINQHGMSFEDFIKEYGQRNRDLFLLSEKAQDNFDKLFELLKSKSDKSVELFGTTKNKGNALEELAQTIFLNGDNPLLAIARNCRTSTNEIDLLMDWSDFARNSRCCSIYEELSDGFICECKYYNKKVSVTYIGKFYSLLKTANIKIGLFFSWEGITGSSCWRDAKGLIKKIALKDDIYILDFDSNDYEKIYKKEESIFNIIHNKYICLKDDIDYYSYIAVHENQEKFIVS